MLRVFHHNFLKRKIKIYILGIFKCLVNICIFLCVSSPPEPIVLIFPRFLLTTACKGLLISGMHLLFMSQAESKDMGLVENVTCWVRRHGVYIFVSIVSLKNSANFITNEVMLKAFSFQIRKRTDDCQLCFYPALLRPWPWRKSNTKKTTVKQRQIVIIHSCYGGLHNGPPNNRYSIKI